VRAIGDSTKGDYSESNLLCIVSHPQLWVPSAFSPNDDGHNDVFKPIGILLFNNTGDPIKDYSLDIYNRWGELIFQSFDMNTGWDGTFMGENCAQGDYLYKLNALGLDGVSSFNLEGMVTLLR
jgi:gliding motility-associated-like protein